MKTITITGSTGLIGSHLIATAPSGFEIFAPSHQCLANPRMPIPSANIIIHAAGYGQPSLFMTDPVDTIRVNTDTTIRLLESLKPGGSFLFCSSTEVYSGLLHAASEDEIGTTTLQHERSCYIEGKRCGEAIVNAFRSREVRAMSARIALAYGPGTKQYDVRAISQFIEQALTKKEIILRDKGEAVRTLCYVRDTVEIMWNIIEKGTQAVYNVGGPTVASIAQIAAIIARKTGAKLTIPDIESGLKGAPQEVRVDFTRIRTEFGKTNYVSLEDGLQTTIDWQRGFHK